MILLGYQNIKLFLQKDYVPNCSEGYSVITKVEKTVPWTYVVRDLKSEEIVQTFYKKELQKKKKKEFIVEKVKKTKGNKLYAICVKWKGYNSSFNGWIDKKRHSINE